MEYETTKKEFDELVASRDWQAVNEMMLDLQECGHSEIEIELWKTVSSEDLLDYKHWDRSVNGDIETQMDDNS